MTGGSKDAIDVAVIGGGPSGLAAATALRRRGVGRVVVLDREAETGGIPRHAHHQGYGLRDLYRVMDGPHYARRHTQLATDAGAELLTSTQVTGWAGDALELTSPRGRERLSARVVVLATGCRERPRSARLVPGTRPQGIVTTGMLQQLVYLAGARPGRRAVVVGAEHVSFSALLTLHHGGARAVVMTTEHARHQSFAAFRAGAAVAYRTPLRTRTRVTEIFGRHRVEAVELTHLDSGTAERVECDLVVFTADWIPDHELAVLGGVDLDPATRGPAVDTWGRTSRPGVLAVGNVLHGAETADVAALSGRRVAAGVEAALAGLPWPRHVPVCAEPPLDWVVPNRLDGSAPRRPFLLRATTPLHDVRIRIEQDDRALHRARLLRVLPGRSVHLAAGWATRVDPAGGAVRLRVERAHPRHGQGNR